MKRYINVIIGSIIVGLSFNLFILPFDLVSSGAYGISALLKYEFNYSPFIFLILFNVACLLIGFISLGFKQTKNYIIPSILIPFVILLSTNINSLIHLYDLEKILAAICGGFSIGIGYSFILKEGYSIGGFYLIQDILNSVKIYNKNTFRIIVEILIFIFTIIVFNFEYAVYSLIVMIIINYMATKTKIGISSSKTFFIITTKEEEVKKYIIEELDHDLTEINVKGGFTNQKNKILMTAMDTKEYYRLKEGIKEIDPKAFISIIDSFEVINKNISINKSLD